ncbi:class II D-tagatose-bisphosphate aldolase, non-catalytic subunit [Priestia filamentosa]|uniref:class II D-tagatose-bisphosphate aldolase non-catalytic subunit n=1 Tax=Priestia filamentosa TaxID=1402861 RepID=UPI001FB323D8|nr:class II D-tagatose-bisphosphate aldolase, non-catalytic subunit [Priestia filamentosa]MED3728326.1 class II D-tagatose-bisphosphate aldolase, non-catalytic subunit [Priestia filamentosa]UOE58656.1 class II D-tagatose-bisphosphate aldolase, non-catalytic subunit [Priestia filamentosa]
MTKLPIKKAVDILLDLQEEGKGSTLLGIGPMSGRLLRASFELAKEKDFPLLFIASRNQVDAEELGGGYVNGWNQQTFMKAIRSTAEQVGFNGLYYVCRDHGGPWQRDKERNDHLDEETAMELGKKSYVADIEAGFDLLHIDPTKDPFEMGKVIPLETVLKRTVELIEYCEQERKKRNLPEIGYEVGTEETNGGLTSAETYESFIVELTNELERKGLPKPTFIVGQTGTLVKKTENVGTFNFSNAKDLAGVAKKYGVGLKEHNGDYIEDDVLLAHLPAHITATNVAPQYGTEETRAYLSLSKVEEKLKEEGLLNETSNIRNILLEHAIKCERWRKWMVGEQKDVTVDEILKDENLAEEILDIAGHYTFNNEEVKEGIQQLFYNLKENSIDGDRFVVDRIKRSLNIYVECYNLEGTTSRMMEMDAVKQ